MLSLTVSSNMEKMVFVDRRGCIKGSLEVIHYPNGGEFHIFLECNDQVEGRIPCPFHVVCDHFSQLLSGKFLLITSELFDFCVMLFHAVGYASCFSIPCVLQLGPATGSNMDYTALIVLTSYTPYLLSCHPSMGVTLSAHQDWVSE